MPKQTSVNHSKSNKENAPAKPATSKNLKKVPALAKEASNLQSSRPKPRPKGPHPANINAPTNPPNAHLASLEQATATPADDVATIQALREEIAALKSQVSERDAQINRLQNTQAANDTQGNSNLIPAPATRPFSPLIKAMRLEDNRDLYNDCRAVVRDTLKQQYEAYKTGWRQHDATFLHEVRTLAEKRLPHLKNYASGWATYEIMKTVIKNGRQYHNLQALKRNPGLRAEREAKKAAAKPAKAAQAKAGGNRDGEKGGNGAKAKAGRKGNREKHGVDDGDNDDEDSKSDDSSSDSSLNEGSESGKDSESANENEDGDDEEQRDDDNGGDQDVEEDEAEEDTAMEQDNGGDNEGEEEAAGDNESEGKGAGNESGEDGVDRAGKKRKRLDRMQARSNKRVRHRK